MVSMTLYNNKSDNIVVQKDLSKILDLTGEIFQEIDVTSPSLIITLADGFIDCNYCYVKEFKRYYYVTNAIILDGNRMRLDLKVDVLMTYAPYILNSSQHIVRQEVLYNLQVKDEETPILNGTFIQYRNPDLTNFTFTTEDLPSDYCYVLNAL